MIKKVLAVVFAIVVVVSLAIPAFASTYSGSYSYKIVCKAPDSIPVIAPKREHSATTIITKSSVHTGVKYNNVVRSELRYKGGTVIRTKKQDCCGSESKDNKIVASKVIAPSDFKNTFHNTTLGVAGSNYGASHTFYGSNTITGTRYF